MSAFGAVPLRILSARLPADVSLITWQASRNRDEVSLGFGSTCQSETAHCSLVASSILWAVAKLTWRDYVKLDFFTEHKCAALKVALQSVAIQGAVKGMMVFPYGELCVALWLEAAGKTGGSPPVPFQSGSRLKAFQQTSPCCRSMAWIEGQSSCMPLLSGELRGQGAFQKRAL